MAPRKSGIDLSPLKELLRLQRQSPEMDSLFKKYGALYLGDVRFLYVQSARGSGRWEPLKKATKRRRRLGGRGGKVEILRDTGTMFNALTPKLKGSLFQPIQRGIRVGFAEGVRHPGPPQGRRKKRAGRGRGSSGRRATIRQIAIFHDEGLGNNPKREILIRDARSMRSGTIRTIQNETKRTISVLGKKSERKLRRR